MIRLLLFQEHEHVGGAVFFRYIDLPIMPRQGEYITLGRLASKIVQVEHVVGQSCPRIILEDTGKPAWLSADQTIKAMKDLGWSVK